MRPALHNHYDPSYAHAKSLSDNAHVIPPLMREKL
jgi:hypothetical protein